MSDKYIDDQKVLAIYQVYKQECEQARLERSQKDKMNFDAYHLRQDFSEKTNGQSTEFLPKVSMAVEQGANFMQQGLVDMGDWFRAEPSPGLTRDQMLIKPSTIQMLLTRQLENAKFMTKVGDATKLGMLASIMVAKIGGQWVPKPKYKVETKMKNGTYKKSLIKIEDKKWQLRIDLIQPEDYIKDPTGNGLYEGNHTWMDFYEIEALSKGKDAIYDPEVVAQLKASGASSKGEREASKARETGQNTTHNGHRKQIKVTELWGNWVDESGELIWENCVATIANDMFVLQRPTENPYWHGETPYVMTPLLTVPGSVDGKALMDAPAQLNMAINEMFNLILDGGLMSVHGIKQLRESYLSDPAQVEDGIGPGTTLIVTTALPPGQAVLERVDTATIPADSLNTYNLLNQEFVTSALTSDLRMGVQSFRAVKATEVVESSQAITSMFTGLAKHIEADWVKPILEKSWKTAAQHMDDLDEAEVSALIGRDVAEQISKMGREEVFADTVQSCAFEVFGISERLNKQKDAAKFQALLQTIAAAPILMEEFSSQYSLQKLMTEIMRSLDINTAKLENDDKQAAGPGPGQPDPTQAGRAPGDPQSQIDQSAAGPQVDQAAQDAQPANGTGAIPAPNFPASRATPAG